MKKDGAGKKRISDNVKAGLLRWWLAGMTYFFVGFGTQMGILSDPLDLIFLLGVGMGLVTVLIYNPIAYGMFDIKRRGQIANQSYYARKGWQNAAYKLKEIFKSLVVVGLVYLTYQNVNLFLNRRMELPADNVLIPGEPILFATLYLLYYQALGGLADTIRSAVQKGGQQ